MACPVRERCARTLGRANADERNLLAELNAAIDDGPARGRPDDGRDLGMLPGNAGLGELLTRGDVCHVHADRAAAERCGVLLGGARPSGSGSMRSGPRSTARGVVADERRERSLHGAMLLIVERNGVMEAESS